MANDTTATSTINIDRDLHERLRQEMHRRNLHGDRCTMRSLAEDAIATEIARKTRAGAKPAA